MAMLWQVSEEKNPILDHHRKLIGKEDIIII